jgi:prolyl-tRNA editing enzyme YbaK/EbsC (Cys-tRNA(Pro) deacylase)
VSPEFTRALEALRSAYELLPCDPDAADTAAFCALYGFAPRTVANTILVASKKEPRRYAACVVPADRQLDVNHKVRELMNASKLSFATADEAQRLTGMALGGVSPFGLPQGLPVYVDEVLLSVEGLILGGGNRSCKVRVPGRVLSAIPGVLVVPGLSRPPS